MKCRVKNRLLSTSAFESRQKNNFLSGCLLLQYLDGLPWLPACLTSKWSLLGLLTKYILLSLMSRSMRLFYVRYETGELHASGAPDECRLCSFVAAFLLDYVGESDCLRTL